MNKIALRYGLMMAAGFVGFFLLMYLFGLSESYNFRIFNALIHLIFIYLAIRVYYDQFKAQNLSGVVVGMLTSFIGVLLFCLFLLLFLTADDELMTSLQTNIDSIGHYLNPFTSSLIVFGEGMIVSLLASYVLMRVEDARRENKP